MPSSQRYKGRHKSDDSRSRSPSPPPHRSRKDKKERKAGSRSPPPRARGNAPSASPSPSPPRRRRRPRRDSSGRGRRHEQPPTPSPPPPQPPPPAVTARATSDRSLDEIRERTQRDLFGGPEADGPQRDGEEAAFAALGSRTKCEDGFIFQGPEFDEVAVKEQRKIQIDIRRTIPEHRISGSPVRRRIIDPDRVKVARRADEGHKPIFDRDDILLWLPPAEEQRRVNLVRDSEKPSDPAASAADDPRRRRRHSPTPPPSQQRRTSSSRRRGERRRSPTPPPTKRRPSSDRPRDNGDLRSRLGGGRRAGSPPSRSDPYASKLASDLTTKVNSVRDRLGSKGGRSGGVDGREHGERDGDRRRSFRASDNDEDGPTSAKRGRKNGVMDREELERNRPETKPWDVNPEFVPTAGRYYEHDNRETFEPRTFEGARGFNRGRGGRGRDFRGGGFRRDFGRGGGFQRDFGRGGGMRRNFDRNDDSSFSYASRGRFNRGRNRPASPNWKHDLFEDEPDKPEEPSSTTNED